MPPEIPSPDIQGCVWCVTLPVDRKSEPQGASLRCLPAIQSTPPALWYPNQSEPQGASLRTRGVNMIICAHMQASHQACAVVLWQGSIPITLRTQRRLALGFDFDNGDVLL